MRRLLSLATAAVIGSACPAQLTKDPVLVLRSHVERVEVDADGSGFIRHVRVEGIVLHGTYPFVIFSDGLEELTAFTGSYTDADGREVKLKEKDLRARSLVTDVFYSDLKGHFVDIGATAHLALEWSTRCDDVMLIGGFDLAPAWPTAELDYEVVVPHGLQLLVRGPAGDSAAYTHAVDSTSTPGPARHRFTATRPFDAKPGRPMHRFPFVDERRGQRIRLAVVPRSDAQGFATFEAWYARLVAPVAALDTATIGWVERTTAAFAAPREKARALFNEVKDRVAYIDLEDNLNAFRPRPPARIWAYRKGDCKDMANLLCQAYRHLGIDAHLAISATIGHGVDLDFPALGSADHVICVARFDNGPWTYLDATEKECVFGMPSRQIQDRHILIVGGEGVPHHVPAVPVDSNRCTLALELAQEGTALHGTARMERHGLAAVRLRSGLHGTNRAEADEWLVDRVLAGNTAMRLSAIDVSESEAGVGMTGRVDAPNMVNGIDGKRYTALKFLPFPHDLPHRIPADAALVTGEAMHRELRVHLTVPPDMRLQAFAPVHEEAQGIVFTFTATEPAPGEVLLTSTYRCPYVTIPNDLRPAYEQVQLAIERTLKRTLVHASP